MDLLNTYLIYLIPVFGLIGIIAMAIKSAWVTKQDAGDGDMVQLAGYIADGAMAFLRAEWKVLSYFRSSSGPFISLLRHYSSNFKSGYSHIVCGWGHFFRHLQVFWGCVLQLKPMCVPRRLPVPVWLKH